MVKNRSQYVCQQCGFSQVGWFGKCPECGAWNSAVETAVATGRESRRAGEYKKSEAKLVSLASVSISATARMSTKITELDRVLGGGLVKGQVILIAGEPGIGKSTILLQLADKLGNALYVSGEESVSQIKVRADRLGIKNKKIQILEETDIDTVIQEVSSAGKVSNVSKANSNGTFLIVDSIQTMQTSDLSGMAGSVGQVRESAYRLVKLAKSRNIPIFIVGHVTKEGTVAGPSVLMHIVDTVLWFEGDRTTATRILRAVKNRFGPTDEVGVFEMQDRGLEPVDNPEKLFLSAGNKNSSGNVITSVLQGTRPLLIEIQSLVVSTKLPIPRRVAQGMDAKRLELLLAVLTRRCGLPLYEFDVFVNIAGGITIKNDPSADLAVCLSLASSFFDKPLPRNVVATGEIGLLGDVRGVVAEERRIKEARRLGYTKVISNREVNYLQEAIKKYIK
ncbi:DNA repair protein RadA [Candidatus Woesebacteria bacterium RIFCSPLOWO2_01_FULL_39_23]|uniref:DNA repair protein RadA n=1 Tax=Candidatus Woesebacteria bacterium RIFCSPHIGHO2_01_FULL_40_22 TaxID=1802499 RepID=A0A1F7YIH0_9BACT|nr:MAG: DNA repair protein RadA [Candidatus Woesebacteria bacterium RBG_16_40_11]OGM26315.1 MAG: DNA repair protein RadA [Candidatus Woesebacteria bacterium RIFCSPHIGHO2_01_FULL_40_22]OGM38423.1 MAG: DNA repair protein RadA [Candidatus Woesebacteria bacterium RIFCSPHIGHO2_12_FULL_38_9]OGM62870.1 MAG: DNA repair protein RadA [Candidatus Woesebacteria bacterium RIFCSPLOWO2_01_FULL_39_23]